MIGTNDTKKPIPVDIYADNLRQIINSIKVNGKTPIIATLPVLNFSPYYMFNREYIDIYNIEIKKIAIEMNVLICEMNSLEGYLIDGVHFTHEGYKEVAKKWSKKILSLT